MKYNQEKGNKAMYLAKRAVLIGGAFLTLGCGACGLLPHSPRPEHGPAYAPTATASATPTPAYTQANPELDQFSQFFQNTATPTPELIIENSFVCLDDNGKNTLFLRTDVLGDYENYGEIETKVLRGSMELDTCLHTVYSDTRGQLYCNLSPQEKYNIGDVLNIEVLLYDTQGNFSPPKNISQLTLDELCLQPAPTSTPVICPTYAPCPPAPTCPTCAPTPTCPVCPPCATPTPTPERERQTPTPGTTPTIPYETPERGDRSPEQDQPFDDPVQEPAAPEETQAPGRG